MEIPASASPSAAPAPSGWILLVDDEPTIIPLITTVLERYGMPVRDANSGEAAMAALDRAGTPPSLLICDVLMPGIDGLEHHENAVKIAKCSRLQQID